MTQPGADPIRARGGGIPHLRVMQPEDAFFLYAEAPGVPQLLGGVVVFEERLEFARVREQVAARLAGLPNLRRRLVADHAPWRRPRWLLEDSVDVDAHVKERVLGRDGTPTTLTDLVDDFFATPLDLRRPAWELSIVQGIDGGRTGLVVKLHHALGDGFAALDSMLGLLDPPDFPVHGAPSTDSGTRMGEAANRARAGHSLLSRARRVGRTVNGVWSLAGAGAAPASMLSGLTPGPKRRYARLAFPVDDVRATAAGHGARTNEVLLAVLSDGLDRFLAGVGEVTQHRSVRAMVPRTLRTPRSRHLPGNLTAAISLDLPLGPMSPRQRLTEIRVRSGRLMGRGQPEATRFVIKAMGLLPAGLHAWAARNAYNSHWFNLIVSVIPGPKDSQHLAGVRLAEVYPVLPVASGVGLAIGLMRWGDAFTLGLTADPGLVPDVDDLAAAIREAFVVYRSGVG